MDGPTPSTIHQAANPPSGYSSTWGMAFVSSSSFFIPDSKSTRICSVGVSEVGDWFFNSEPSISTAFDVDIEIDLSGDIGTGWCGWEMRKDRASTFDIYRRHSGGLIGDWFNIFSS
jgi:hypothetical protein